MEVICVDNGDRETGRCTLTLGKKYLAKNEERDWESMGVMLTNDKGCGYFYARDRFAKADEIRDKKLNSLLENSA